jgi:hypothetical protein
LKYKLKAGADVTGTKTISGTFSYLDEEERKKLEIPTIIIDVKGGEVATTETTETTEGSEGTETTETTETTTEATEGTSTADGNGDVTCSRSIEKDGDAFLVIIDVEKGNNGGFARIKDNVPSGFIAESVDNAGAVFKFVDNSVKFLWTSLPSDKSTIQVKYRLLPDAASPGMYDVSGEFSGEFLIVDDKPTSVEIPYASFELEGEGFVAVTEGGNGETEGGNGETETEGGNGETETEGGNGETESGNGETAQEGGNGETETEGGNGETSIPTGNGDVMYKVQVMAAHRTVSNSYIKKHYGYSGGIDIENHEGWVKYTTGSYGVYKDARDKRNSLDSYNFPGPFVTAYKQGERITVQEALTLTNQEWVQ